MQISRSIFKAYDVRGVVGDDLGEAQLFALGRALATRYPDCGDVAVGRDGRLSSATLADALIRGLNASGAAATDVGEVPTPALYFAARRSGSGSGLMVTGSHNPPQYNGVKMMMQGHTLAGDDITALHAVCVEESFREGAGQRVEKAVCDDYVRSIADNISLKRPLRIAVDCGNGVAGPAVRALYERLGCDVTCLYCEVDGHFPNHHPNPSVPANLEELITTVREQALDVGLAFDGDGDRLGVVDDTGRIIWADRQLMIFAQEVLNDYPGATIIYDVKSSRHLERVIERCGGVALMCRTGHSFVKGAMERTGALLAGEMSGHIFFNDRWFGFDDALYAGARLLEVLARSRDKCGAIFDRLPPAVSTPELHVHFEHEGEQHEFMRRLSARAKFDAAEISRIDGLRVEFDNGWGLVRASNTTPCLVLRFESDSRPGLERLQSAFREQLLKVNPELEMPF